MGAEPEAKQRLTEALRLTLQAAERKLADLKRAPDSWKRLGADLGMMPGDRGRGALIGPYNRDEVEAALGLELFKASDGVVDLAPTWIEAERAATAAEALRCINDPVATFVAGRAIERYELLAEYPQLRRAIAEKKKRELRAPQRSAAAATNKRKRIAFEKRDRQIETQYDELVRLGRKKNRMHERDAKASAVKKLARQHNVRPQRIRQILGKRKGSNSTSR